MCMTKIVLGKNRSRRQQVAQRREDSEDYLDVLKTRQNSLGKKTYTQAEMEARYAAK
jgi:hypothetical protein